MGKAEGQAIGEAGDEGLADAVGNGQCLIRVQVEVLKSSWSYVNLGAIST